MPLTIREIHAASSPDALNEEWFVLENDGEHPFSTAGCAIAVGRGKGSRPKPVGTLDPGFTLQPQERIRVITGNPGRKAHGKPPEDDVRNYHLFLGQRLLGGPGAILAMTLRQHELVRASYDPEAPGGVAKEG